MSDSDKKKDRRIAVYVAVITTIQTVVAILALIIK